MKLTDNEIDRCSKDRITSTVAATIGSYHGRGCQLLRKSVLRYLHEWSLPVGTDPKEIQPLRSQTVCSVLFCFALLCSVAPHGGWDFKHYIGPCIIRWPTIQRWDRILVRTDDYGGCYLPDERYKEISRVTIWYRKTMTTSSRGITHLLVHI